MIFFFIKNEEFCIKNEKVCIKNEELCIKNEELCIKNDESVRFGADDDDEADAAPSGAI